MAHVRLGKKRNDYRCYGREVRALETLIESNPTEVRLDSLYIFLRFTDDALDYIVYDTYNMVYYVSAWVNHKGNTFMTRFRFTIDIKTLKITPSLQTENPL